MASQGRKIFYLLRGQKNRPGGDERIVQALIFTIIVQAANIGVKFLMLQAGSRTGVSFAAWTQEAQLVSSILLAGVLGFFLAWAANTDKLHRLLRATGITCQTSFASEWYGAFSRNKGYVVLHLNDGRRLYGWPEEWPNTPGTGHFVIAEAEWLLDDGTSIELTNVNQILVRAEDVKMAEIMKIWTTPREEIETPKIVELKVLPGREEKANGRS